eukprot:SAG11_NODE_11094_length_784_cov_0.872993_2_plen_92_part_01
MPTGLGQLPPFESYQMDRGSCGADGSCGRTYRYLDSAPLYRFGDGRSLTTFTTRHLTLVLPNAGLRTAPGCPSLNVTLTVTNTGKMDGDEVT